MNTINIPTQSKPDDAALVVGCLAGDKAAFGLLIGRHRPRLARLLRAIFHEAAEVDDLLQETFLQAYLGLDRLREAARFSAWIYSIALNLARMRLRSRPPPMLSLEEVSGGAETGHWFTGQPVLPETAVEKREMAFQLHQAIADLPPAERDAVWQVFFEGLSHRETAVALGTTTGAIKVRVHRGRQRLRTALESESDQERPDRAIEEVTMIEAMIHDIMVKVKQKETPEEWSDVISSHRVVLLKETAGSRAVPIWIGPNEAEWIITQLQGKSFARPLIYTLMKRLLDLGDMRLEQVAVNRLHEEIFYGVLKVRTRERQLAEVDCRPSDALTLAIHLDVPIFVTPEVMDQASIPPDIGGGYHFEREFDGRTPAALCDHKVVEPGTVWRSWQSLPTT